MKAEDPTMNRITKMALVLLYLLQLMVVFRESLEHFFVHAVASIHRRSDLGEHGHEEPKHEAQPIDVRERLEALRIFREHIAAVSLLTLHAVVLSSTHGDHHHPHPIEEHDRHKDRVHKFRHRDPRTFLLQNLWNRIRAFAAPDIREEL